MLSSQYYKGGIVVQKTENKKVFDDFPTVDCNDCEQYYLNTCDGVSEAQNRPCTAFKPVRGMNMPKEIKSLRTQIFWLGVGGICLAISVILGIIRDVVEVLGR